MNGLAEGKVKPRKIGFGQFHLEMPLAARAGEFDARHRPKGENAPHGRRNAARLGMTLD